jgi:vitamin B12 transporter
MRRLPYRTAAAALGLAAFPLLASGPARAQEPPPDRVEEVVITASRLPAPIDITPGARVIDEAEIEASGAVFAADVLRTVPGLSVFESGGFGGIASVRIRGASADKTLVLVDGAPMNDASQPSGGFDFAAFDLADIRRVEILSGPQGSLWGSDAIGGVIAFTTRETDGLRASAEAGSYGTVRGAAALGRREDRWALGLSLAGLGSDGISKADAADGNPERDGLRTWTAGVNGRLDPTEALRLEARLRWSDSRTEVDGYVPPFFTLGDTPEVATSTGRSGLVRATVQGPLAFEHQLSLSGSDIERAQTGGFPFHYDASRQVWRWTASRSRPEESWGLTVGAERESVHATLSDGTEQDTGTSSAFAVARVRPVERLTLTGSLRWDDPKGYRGVTTGRAAAALDLGGGFSLDGSWGQGFKTPTISQSACDFCFPAGPSVSLKPERAEGWDLGGRWVSADGRVRARVSGYRLAVRDQIDFVFDPVTFDFRYRNIARTLTRGLEAEAEADLGAGVSARAAWAWTDAVDQSTGARLLRVPERQGSVALGWTGERGHALLTVRGESDQADAGGVRKGFVTADAAGGWRLNETVELTLRIENLADERYQEVLGYGEPGRSAYAGVRLRY